MGRTLFALSGFGSGGVGTGSGELWWRCWAAPKGGEGLGLFAMNGSVKLPVQVMCCFRGWLGFRWPDLMLSLHPPSCPCSDRDVQLMCCRAFLAMSMVEQLRPRLMQSGVADAVKEHAASKVRGGRARVGSLGVRRTGLGLRGTWGQDSALPMPPNPSSPSQHGCRTCVWQMQRGAACFSCTSCKMQQQRAPWKARTCR